MSQSAKAQEPSMEEILASIRRIIADDDTSKVVAKPAPAPPAARPAAMPPRTPVAPSPRPAAAARPAPPPPQSPPPSINQHDLESMLAGLETPPSDEPAEPDAQDILDLTESMAAPAPAPAAGSSFQTIDGHPDVFFRDAAAHAEPAPPRASEEARRAAASQNPQPAPAPAPDRSLLSNTASAAVDSAFNALAQTVLVHNARTLEDLVREMLRPMLKSWLDDNLPSLVERIVKAEIERVSRGRS